MKDKVFNIGITSSGGDFVSSQILSLKKSKKNNFKIIAFNENYHELSTKIADEFEIIPCGSSEVYIENIYKLVDKYQLNILLPWSDEEALKLSSCRAELSKKGCKVLVSPTKVMKIITNKQHTYEKLKLAGIRTPEYSLVHNWLDIKKCIIDYGFPNKTIILKPSNSRGGRGVHVFLGQDNPPNWLGTGRREVRLKNLDECNFNISEFSEWLVMPCLEAPVYDVDVYSKKGQLITGFVRKRINPTGIPFTGNVLINDNKTIEYAENICKVLELDSIHDLDMMTHPKYGPVLIEVNPRPSGSLAALSIAGYPFLENVFLNLMGEKIDLDINNVSRDVKILSYLEGLVL